MIKVFVNGTFDVIHRGHIELFRYAKSCGDQLFVAVDSDRRVSELKGCNRPFNNELDRIMVLASIKYIDSINIFDSEKELEDIICSISPDIMIVGSDWKEKKVVGSHLAKELMFFDRIEKYSTTDILSYGIKNE
jgi:D-beta-D-heptose 7-phosphate kinase/D-beta-D-heptose 1-phosphate adenosyltransferase